MPNLIGYRYMKALSLSLSLSVCVRVVVDVHIIHVHMRMCIYMYSVCRVRKGTRRRRTRREKKKTPATKLGTNSREGTEQYFTRYIENHWIHAVSNKQIRVDLFLQKFDNCGLSNFGFRKNLKLLIILKYEELVAHFLKTIIRINMYNF